MTLMDWHDGGAVAGFIAALATVFGFGLSRTDRAQEKREQGIRDIAQKVVDAEADRMNVDIRLNTIETMLPEIKDDVKDVKATVASTNEKLDQLLLAGRIPIKRTDY